MPTSQGDKCLWLAGQIFKKYPQDVTGLKFFTLDCGCIYYLRVFRDGLIDLNFSIYRDVKDGPCEICMRLEEDFKGRVIDECVVYNSGFQLEEE